jgi:stearoyl-CoA desaturase (delta-9 desaturase)
MKYQRIIHLTFFLLSLAALIVLFHYTFSQGTVFWLISSYIYYKIVVGLMGNQIAQHRYFSHNSFVTGRFRHWALYFVSLTTAIDPVRYANGHRHHHNYSDQANDLHSIHNHWDDIFSPISGISSYKGSIKYARIFKGNMSKLNKHWYLIFLLYVLMVSAIDWKIGIFLALAGPAWNYIHMILFRVWLVHVELPGSYKNFNVNDRSWNNKWIQVLDIGEGLHNNHHAYPNKYNQAVQLNEFDPAGWVVKQFFDINKKTL